VFFIDVTKKLVRIFKLFVITLETIAWFLSGFLSPWHVSLFIYLIRFFSNKAVQPTWCI
jgi:hypothetical protein